MNRIARRPGRRRRGFTLVELLVAVALVVLMMTMFAEIFSLASDAVSTQKGAAVNDQKVRTFTTLLRTDINSRTFRDVMPFNPIAPTVPEERIRFINAFVDPMPYRRRGYFAISENDPDDPTDDVLSFTIEVDSKDALVDGALPLIYGRAQNLSAKGGFSDHPEFDDGVANNEQAASTMAEVAYFLRNGNLYRSVRLIREPYAGVHSTVQGEITLAVDSGQPTEVLTTTPAFTSQHLFTSAENNFSALYDYSAYRHPFDAMTPGSDRVMFHTVGSLNNSLDGGGDVPSSNVDGAFVPLVLAIPHLRFGHTITGNGGSGRPDEFVPDPTNPPTNQRFIGRWLQQEMADGDFDYPGTGAASPAATGTFDPNTGLVAPYNNTLARRGAELLVPNVHEFDIQVWDDDPKLGAPIWTDVGASHTVDGDGDGTPDGFYHANKNANTAYCPPNRYRFDTWHPQLGSPPPFRGVHWHDPAAGFTSPDGMPGVAGVNDDGNTVTDEGSPNVADPREIGWIGSDDERPLRQIRVRVRFYDIKSGQVRQLTLTLPLIDNQSL